MARFPYSPDGHLSQITAAIASTLSDDREAEARPDGKGGYLVTTDRREVITALTLGLTRGPQRERFQAAEVMSKIVAERLVAELESSGFVVMRKSAPLGGTSPLQYPEGWPHTPNR
jgi:hypothetical protein